MTTPSRPAAVVATPRAWLVLPCAAALAGMLAAGAAIAQADPPMSPPAATRPVPAATPGNLTREEKRCNAGVRRIDRHKEKLAETKRAREAHRTVAASCGSARTCERAAHRENTLDARERREERQLAKLEAEARNLCAAVVPAPKRR